MELFVVKGDCPEYYGLIIVRKKYIVLFMKYLPWVILKSEGLSIAGHRNLRKIDAEMRLSAISSRPISASRSLKIRKHSRNSTGKCEWLARMRLQASSTAALKFCCCLCSAATDATLSGSTSQSPPSTAPRTTGPNVSCKYRSPVSFRYASMAFVAKLLPRNVSRSSSINRKWKNL